VAISRVSPEAVTSPVFRIKGQRSRWRYPNEKVPPEYCEILKNVNLSERGTPMSRYGYEKYNSTILPSGEIPVGLWQGTFSGGSVRNVVVTKTKIYSDDGTTRTDITGSNLTGGNDDRIRFAFIKDQLLLNPAVGATRVWDGDITTPGTTADLSGILWSRCTDLMVHNNLVLVMNTTESGVEYPTRIRWCDINRETFEVDITNWPIINRYEIYDGGPRIIGGVDSWGKALIFKADGLYPGEITFDEEGHYTFVLDKPRRGFSPISTHSIIARPEFVFGAAREGLFTFDENLQFFLVNTDDVTTWLELNKSRLQYAQSFIREDEHQVRVLCSSSTNTTGHDAVLVWDWESGDTWIDYPEDVINCGQRIVISNSEYDWFGGYGRYLYKGNDSSYSDDAGSGFNWRIKMHANDLGLPGKAKHVLNVRTLYRHRIDSDTVSLEVSIDAGQQGSVSDTISIKPQYAWNTGLSWNSGIKWPGGSVLYTDTWVNRVCETITPDWQSSNPATIEGYQVEYILLEP